MSFTKKIQQLYYLLSFTAPFNNPTVMHPGNAFSISDCLVPPGIFDTNKLNTKKKMIKLKFGKIFQKISFTYYFPTMGSTLGSGTLIFFLFTFSFNFFSMSTGFG